mmetsp:Transcript_16546/g.44929  ORF Transcript_16546/g.44929 Transcript_16546/m.44929 type:complete len:229 (-) Transcript_16546:124-810(-)
MLRRVPDEPIPISAPTRQPGHALVTIHTRKNTLVDTVVICAASLLDYHRLPSPQQWVRRNEGRAVRTHIKVQVYPAVRLVEIGMHEHRGDGEEPVVSSQARVRLEGQGVPYHQVGLELEEGVERVPPEEVTVILLPLGRLHLPCLEVRALVHHHLDVNVDGPRLHSPSRAEVNQVVRHECHDCVAHHLQLSPNQHKRLRMAANAKTHEGHTELFRLRQLSHEPPPVGQ